jgi:hypothetical protein
MLEIKNYKKVRKAAVMNWVVSTIIQNETDYIFGLEYSSNPSFTLTVVLERDKKENDKYLMYCLQSKYETHLEKKSFATLLHIRYRLAKVIKDAQDKNLIPNP